MDYSSLKRTKKLGKKKKQLRMKQNFEQCSGRLSTGSVQLPKLELEAKRRATAGEHLVFAP